MGDLSSLAVPWPSYLTFTQNFFMVHAGGFGSVGMLVTWSLAIEEQFYLVIPFVVRTIRGRGLLTALILVILAAPLLRLILNLTLAHGGLASFALMPCRADALCLGVLCACLVRHPAFWNGLLARRNFLCWATGILFVGVAYISYPQYDVFSFRVTTWGYSLVALFYTSCLLSAVSASAGFWYEVLRSPWLMRLGTLAYCTYLLHFPLIQTGRSVFGILLPSHARTAYLLGGLSAVAVTLALASLSWRFLEEPLLRRGRKYQYC